MRQVIIVIFHYSWGEVDWLLPVLFQIKNIAPQIKIVVFFSSYWRKHYENLNHDGFKYYLFFELQNIADDIVIADNFSNPIQKSLISNSKEVKVILRCSITDFSEIFIKNFPHATVIRFPDSFYFFGPQKFNHIRWVNNWEKKDIHKELFLIDSPTSAPGIFQRESETKLAFVGSPRCDAWWTDYIVKSPLFSKSLERQMARNSKKVFLFNSTFSYQNFGDFPIETHDYVTKSIAEISIGGKDNNFLFIKHHPRQNISLINKAMKDFDPSRWMISTFHVKQLASISDFIFSAHTSTLLDALSVSKPVIEFNPYIFPAHYLMIDKNGRLMSKLAHYDLAIHADTQHQAYEYMIDYFNPNTDKARWREQIASFEKMFPSNKNTSHYVAELILSKIFTNHQLHYIEYKKHTPISGDIKLFQNEKNCNDNSLHLQMKQIQTFSMPVSSILFKELLCLFPATSFIATGTVNEHMLSEASILFKEVYSIELASDLYQVQKFDEIINNKNIKIFDSAFVLNSLIENKKCTYYFWLDNHEISNKTYKSKTQTPVLEEIKVISSLSLEGSVILINNLRHFQPIITRIDENMEHKYRDYPSLQEIINIVFKTNDNYSIAVLGDILIIYPSSPLITTSKGVDSCTISRIYDGSNFPIQKVLQAEENIAFNLDPIEKNTVSALFDNYHTNEDSNGGGHYALWRGLIHFGNGQYTKAKSDFSKAIELQCNHWRVAWYLALAAYWDNDMKLAENMIKVVKKIVPDSFYVKELQEKIEKKKLG